ncbi:hypothetical protein DSO57_1028228 [Entomophthora muscae]|uniref:Uncharacterized protein n=1 Tax=Entomophthora muscae TaxID=34485 RepID=A0ACC2TCE9_9FUNG|nr:hypothetical protein DSO57_1028228 [Entomophthora muscae]
MQKVLFSRVTVSKLSPSFSRRLFSNLKQDLKEECLKYPSVVTLPIHWGQQDSFKHLNNVDWLRLIETGRIDYVYIMCLKMSEAAAQMMMDGTGAGFIVKSQECQYRFPITFPDSLTIATKVENLSKDRFCFYTKTFSNRYSKLASESKVVCVSYDHTKRMKCDFNEEFLNAVAIMEKDPAAIQKEAADLPLRKYISI